MDERRKELVKKGMIFLAVLFLLILAGCGEDASKEENDRSSDEKLIKVGAVPDSFPTSFKEDDELKGFTVDIIKAIFEHMEYDVEWVITDWNGVLANLQTGKVDTATNFAATEERGEEYYFTSPYYNSKAVVATAEEEPKLESLNDLEGKQLASILGTNFENVLEENFPDEQYELITYESNEVVYTDVASGKIDGFIFGREQLMAQINKKDIPLQIVDEPFGDQPVAMPFQKTEENEAFIEEVNQAIEELKANGIFSEISLEYFGIDLVEE